MTKNVVDAMNKFQTLMFEVYELAEGLRDCTADNKEKNVFNKTRGALYDLKYEARDLFYKWQATLPKDVVNDK